MASPVLKFYRPYCTHKQHVLGNDKVQKILLALQHIRDVTDPEHPYTLEQLNVVSEDLIEADDLKSSVR